MFEKDASLALSDARFLTEGLYDAIAAAFMQTRTCRVDYHNISQINLGECGYLAECKTPPIHFYAFTLLFMYCILLH